MFKTNLVKNCPHTRKSIGIVNMPPDLIAQLAAAVYDEDEWAIVLTGERKENGYMIDVTGYFLPPQERSAGSVTIAEIDLDPDVVGVIHSHHRMTAFFSVTDVTTLNTRFPMSIVVAQNSSTYLGFAYLGTGKVTLPCGSVGEIEFKIQPTVGPAIAEVKREVFRETDLGDCDRAQNISPDYFHVEYTAACGLKEPKARAANAFGKEDSLLEQVKSIPRPLPVFKTNNKNTGDSKSEGWFSSIIPDRFKQETEPEPIALTKCEVCGDFNQFWNWECENCGQSEYCISCNVGHDMLLRCPRDNIVITGA